MDLPSILAETLTEQGYDVEDAPAMEGRSGATYPVSLIARQGDERFIVDLLASRAVTGKDVEALSSIVDDTGVDGAILFAIEGVLDDALAAPEDRIDVHDRSATAEAIGLRMLDHLIEAGSVDVEPHEAGQIDAVGPTRADPAATPRPDASTQDPGRSHPPAQTADGGQDAGPEDGDAELLTASSSEPDRSRSQDPPQAPDQTPGQAEGQEPEGFLSPEEMAQRAQQMLEEGELPDDGDAELIVDDEPAETAPDRGADQTPEPTQGGGEPDPAPEARPSTTQTDPEPDEPAMEGGQVFEDADCELLPSEPRDADPAPQEPEAPPADASSEEVERPPTQAAGTSSEDRQPASSPAAAAGPPSEDDQAFLSGATMPPRVSADEARREAEGALFQVDEARLELIPFHVFGYECLLESDGTTKDHSGRLWVSAQSGGVVEDPEGDLVEDPGVPHERFQAKIEPASAASNARSHLVDNLEIREELRDDYSETAIIERVTLTPKEDTVRLEHLGTAFAPRWRVEGQNGTLFVDAITGDLVNG